MNPFVSIKGDSLLMNTHVCQVFQKYENILEFVFATHLHCYPRCDLKY